MSETASQRQYETIYILRPDTGREVTEGLATKVAAVINEGGTLTQVENWGRRKLAFDVARQKRGLYVYLQYLGGGEIVSELERTLGLQESVLKYQTVKIADVAAAPEAVSDEDVRFEHVEPTEEEEETESYAQSLGLDLAARREPRRAAEEESGEASEAKGKDAAVAPAAEAETAAEPAAPAESSTTESES